MPEESAWGRWGRFVAAAALAALVAWFAFVAHREVPILDWFDLGIHEVGHMVMLFAPRMLMFIAGSAAQIAVPLGLAWYFGILRRDPAGGGFCLAWAGASAWDVSVYIADAPVQALPLIGGGQHDWAYLLGSRGFDTMHLADEIAGFVEFTGAVLAVVGIGIALRSAYLGLMAAPVPVVAPAESAPVAAQPDFAAGIDDPWLAAAQLPFRHEASSQ
jgi:hypothetical protein